MKKNILIALCLVASTTMAQTPKWASKMKKAVFSVVTYDANGKIINNTNGFFINDKGVALSDYRSFEGASNLHQQRLKRVRQCLFCHIQRRRTWLASRES